MNTSNELPDDTRLILTESRAREANRLAFDAKRASASALIISVAALALAMIALVAR